MAWRIGMRGTLKPLNELEFHQGYHKLSGFIVFSNGTIHQVIVAQKHLVWFDGKTEVELVQDCIQYFWVLLPNGERMQAFPHFLNPITPHKQVRGVRKLRV